MFLPTLAFAEDTISQPPLLITEIKIKNDTGTDPAVPHYDEFIELYNPSDAYLPLASYSLEYFNVHTPASGQEPTKAVIAEGSLAAKQYLVLAADPSQVPNSLALPLSNLKDSEGLVRLVSPSGDILDQIAWSSTQGEAVSPIVYMPSSGSASSLARRVDEQGLPIFEPTEWQLSTPSPLSAQLISPPPSEDVDPPPTNNEEPPEQLAEEEAETTPETEPNILPLQLSELFPDPASPQTDSENEFVELFNPNPEPIDLAGYKIQTGTNFTYSFTFTDEAITANGYLTVTSGQTSLTLSNTVGRARLVDPNGQIVAETSPYEDADEGNAWALIGGTWQWTTTPTPNAPNVLAVPVVSAATAKSSESKKTSTKKATAKKVSSKKPKTASAKTAKSSADSEDDQADPEDTKAAPLHPAVLAGVGGAALLYGAHEYKQDAKNALHRLKRNRANRRASRQKS